MNGSEFQPLVDLHSKNVVLLRFVDGMMSQVPVLGYEEHWQNEGSLKAEYKELVKQQLVARDAIEKVQCPQRQL
jgi:hypothetical protein